MRMEQLLVTRSFFRMERYVQKLHIEKGCATVTQSFIIIPGICFAKDVTKMGDKQENGVIIK